MRNFRQTFQGVSSEDESFVAKFASVLVSDVDLAVVDHSQALVSFAGQTREGLLAVDAETHTIVLSAVSDRSRNTTAPVRGLSKAIRALGADVGVGNVQVAVVDLLQASVLHQNKTAGASLTDGGRGVL